MPIIKEQPSMNAESSSSPSTQNNGDYCIYKGHKYAINERIEDGCEKICKCMASGANVECEPRCPKQNQTSSSSDKCVSFPDPKDSCCHIELCEVTDDDYEQSPVVIVPPPSSFLNAKNNRTSTGKIHDHEDLIATTATATGSKDDKKHHDANGKYECEHNGSKYTVGTYHRETRTQNLLL